MISDGKPPLPFAGEGDEDRKPWVRVKRHLAKGRDVEAGRKGINSGRDLLPIWLFSGSKKRI